MLGGLLGHLRRSTTNDESPNAVPTSREVRALSPGATTPGVLQAQAKASTKDTSKKISGLESAREEVNFVGIFFRYVHPNTFQRPFYLRGLAQSTFFGGHDDKYETPRDQYIWFKDFALSYNS